MDNKFHVYMYLTYDDIITDVAHVSKYDSYEEARYRADTERQGWADEGGHFAVIPMAPENMPQELTPYLELCERIMK